MIHIRLAEASDQNYVADVFSSQVGSSGNTTVQNLWEVWTQDRDSQLLLAQDATGKIVGFAHLALHRGREGWIEDLMVHSDHQGQGVASALIDRCREIINGLGAHRLGLDVFSSNERAISLYHRLGFEADYGYVRMDGAITHDVVERASRYLHQHDEIAVGSYHPADRSGLSELLNVDQRFVQSHHKAYVFDQSDVEDGFVRTGHVLVARTDATVQPLEAALFQVERVWRDGDRVIPSASLLVPQYPDLPSILISCAIVVTHASPIVPSRAVSGSASSPRC